MVPKNICGDLGYPELELDELSDTPHKIDVDQIFQKRVSIFRNSKFTKENNITSQKRILHACH